MIIVEVEVARVVMVEIAARLSMAALAAMRVLMEEVATVKVVMA